MYENVTKFFKVGKEFKFSKKMNILSECDLRFKNRIPPGYMDATGKNEKDGLQRIGDLIVWYQIIDFATETKKPIILITNDVKIDWCYSTKRSNEARIDRPREELIQEISEKANVPFWMYTFPQFLYVCKKILNISIEESVIKEAEVAASERLSGFPEQEIPIKNTIKSAMQMNKNKVAFKGPNGKYVCTEGFKTYNMVLFSNRPIIDIWETFELINLNDNNIALRSYFGKFVNIQTENDSMLIADRSDISDSNTFQLINMGKDKIALRSANNRYVSLNVETLKLHANAVKIGETEQFTLINHESF